MNGVTNLGLYDFMIDAGQSGQIAELYDKVEAQQKEIDELKTNVERLAQWVLFLATNGKEVIHDNPNCNDASDSEALHN